MHILSFRNAVVLYGFAYVLQALTIPHASLAKSEHGIRGASDEIADLQFERREPARPKPPGGKPPNNGGNNTPKPPNNTPKPPPANTPKPPAESPKPTPTPKQSTPTPSPSPSSTPKLSSSSSKATASSSKVSSSSSSKVSSSSSSISSSSAITTSRASPSSSFVSSSTVSSSSSTRVVHFTFSTKAADLCGLPGFDCSDQYSDFIQDDTKPSASKSTNVPRIHRREITTATANLGAAGELVIQGPAYIRGGKLKSKPKFGKGEKRFAFQSADVDKYQLTDMLGEPLEGSVWSTDHSIERQLITLFLEHVAKGDPGHAQWIKANWMTPIPLPANIKPTEKQKADQWWLNRPSPAAWKNGDKETKYSHKDHQKNFNFLIFQALGTTDVLSPFVLLEQRVNQIKGRFWGDNKPLDQKEVARLVDGLKTGATQVNEVLTPIREVLAVFEYQNKDEVKDATSIAVEYAETELGNAQYFFGSTDPGTPDPAVPDLAAAWRPFIEAEMKRAEQNGKDWLKDIIKDVKPIMQAGQKKWTDIVKDLKNDSEREKTKKAEKFKTADAKLKPIEAEKEKVEDEFKILKSNRAKALRAFQDTPDEPEAAHKAAEEALNRATQALSLKATERAGIYGRWTDAIEDRDQYSLSEAVEHVKYWGKGSKTITAFEAKAKTVTFPSL